MSCSKWWRLRPCLFVVQFRTTSGEYSPVLAGGKHDRPRDWLPVEQSLSVNGPSDAARLSWLVSNEYQGCSDPFGWTAGQFGYIERTPATRACESFSMIEHEFSPDPESVAKVRRFLVRHLSGSVLIDDIMLVTSELATNSIVHARTPFEVAIVRASVLRVEVSDRSVAVPLIGESSNGHGYGLRIVDSLSTRWGVAVTPPGKTVWVEFQDPGTGTSRPVV
jgi:hypothetical protein